MEKLTDILVKHEGLRLIAYDDATGKPVKSGDKVIGKLTIGVGRNVTDLGISEAEAMLLLENDIQRTVLELERTFPWFSALDVVRRDVVISMAFNMGLPRLRGFKNTMAALAQGDYHWAADEMLDSRWARQVGNRAEELAEMMRNGSYE